MPAITFQDCIEMARDGRVPRDDAFKFFAQLPRPRLKAWYEKCFPREKTTDLGMLFENRLKARATNVPTGRQGVVSDVLDFMYQEGV